MTALALLHHPVSVLLARVLLAATFLVSARSKLPDRHGFLLVVLAFNVLPRRLAKVYGFALPWVEAVAGLMLLLGVMTQLGAALSAILLLSFTIAVGLNVARRRTNLNCGCFGAQRPHRIGNTILVRNGALFLLSLYVMLFADGSWAVAGALPSIMEVSQQTPLLMGASLALLVGAILFLVLPLVTHVRTGRRGEA